MSEQHRIAMWSGPRNLSTAMMYSFAQRSDCAVWDEPFYAAYLTATQLEHPLGAEIIKAGLTDPADVISACLGKDGPQAKVFYQKHMTQHMIDGIDRSWIPQMTNVFLLRHPARVLASYAAKRENPTLADIGFTQQLELVDLVEAAGCQSAVILDSADIRNDPKTALNALCDQIDIPFQAEMMSWPKGGNRADGVWAPHWYGAVWQSTGFAGPEAPLPPVVSELAGIYQEALEIYKALYGKRLRF